MYKIVILIDQLEDETAFESGWPEFLAAAEKMPGLIRETTSRVDYLLYGDTQPRLIHELFFDSLPAVRSAFDSSEGQVTGAVLQKITGGKFSLMMADHLEDELSNIQDFKNASE